MATKLFPVVLVIGLAFWVVRVQSQLLTGTPTESPTPSKHPTHKTTETTSPAESTTSALEAESPATSPKPKRTRKKATAEASPTPTPTPVPSPTPRKFKFPRLFKPKRSASPTPVGINPGPAIVDISARKLAEAEALQHREELGHLSRVTAMGELAGSIAHELNQPLSGITSNASAGQRFIDRGDVDVRELRDLLGDVLADARRAADVIRGIRSMVKKGVPARRLVNLNELVMKVVHLVKPNAILYSCELQTLLEPNLPAIEADPVQLKQVLLNLVINAFDAMRDTPVPHRQVVITTERNADGAIHTSVRDYGTGIAEEARNRLFEHFFTTKAEGLGMGLGIVRSIVESHGGTIAAENVDGGGARFHFTLPASAAAL